MNTKKNYKPLKLYELIDMNRGGIYHDFTHGIENRRAWWGFQPYYPPNDEPGFVNENFIKFVESRDNYLIRRPIFHMTTLEEEFNNAVKNLSEYVNKSKNSYKFYNNLRKLQEYLIECGSINEEIVLKPLKNEDGSTKFSTDNNVGGDQFPAYNNKSTEPSIENNLDANSFMYHENDNKNRRIVDEEYLGNIHQNVEVFKNPKSIKRLEPNIRGIVTENGDLYVVNCGNYDIIHNDFSKWLNIMGYPIPSNIYDYLENNIPLQRYEKTNKFYLGESMTTQRINNHIDSFRKIIKRAGNKNPTINFILENINKTFNLDDAIKNLNERQKAWIPGSKAVTVKQKCRLGGVNGKSAACNQGDISNLEFSSLDEETKLDQGFVDGWHSYDILHNDDVAGEMEVSNRDKYMVLNRIYINPEHRGMGHAKDAMKILIDYADKNNKIIALTPDNVWGASKQKLRKWYSSLGFVMNKGRNADYKIQAAMIRYPKNNN